MRMLPLTYPLGVVILLAHILLMNPAYAEEPCLDLDAMALRHLQSVTISLREYTFTQTDCNSVVVTDGSGESEIYHVEQTKIFSFPAPREKSVADPGVSGKFGFGIYPTESKRPAPNGLIYKPLARIDVNLNIGSPKYYFIIESSFFAEKPTPGVTTNSNQGQLDFTKREYDLDVAFAARPLSNENIEFVVLAFSRANLNRGTDLNKPYGFKDGVGAKAIYYFVSDRAWGQLMAGYYLGKHMVDPSGEAFKPQFTAGADVGYDLTSTPRLLSLFLNTEVINSFMDVEAGVATRPFQKSSPNTEFRVAYDRYFDVTDTGNAVHTLIFQFNRLF